MKIRALIAAFVVTLDFAGMPFDFGVKKAG